MAQAPERFYQYQQVFAGGVTATEEAAKVDGIAKLDHDNFALALKHVNRLIDTVENDEPLVSEWYGNACEIYAAMDLTHFCPVDLIIPTRPFFDTIERMHESGTPSDSCALIQLAVWGARAGIIPKPSVITGMLEPCDAQSLMHEAWETVPGWDDIPTISLDPPYGYGDEDIQYFADQLRREIDFLEEHTGHKMDWDELRRICGETNKIYAYWDECNQVLMQKPCVYHSLQAAEWGWTQELHVNWPGDPEVTEFFKNMAETAAALYEQKRALAQTSVYASCGPISMARGLKQSSAPGSSKPTVPSWSTALRVARPTHPLTLQRPKPCFSDWRASQSMKSR